MDDTPGLTRMVATGGQLSNLSATSGLCAENTGCTSLLRQAK